MPRGSQGRSEKRDKHLQRMNVVTYSSESTEKPDVAFSIQMERLRLIDIAFYIVVC